MCWVFVSAVKFSKNADIIHMLHVAFFLIHHNIFWNIFLQILVWTRSCLTVSIKDMVFNNRRRLLVNVKSFILIELKPQN